MFRVNFLIAILFGVVGASIAEAAEVTLNRQGDEVVIATGVQSDFAGTEASVSAPDPTTIEVTVAGADFAVDGKRQLFRFEDGTVKTVSVSKDKTTGVIRFNVKEKNAALAAEMIRVTRADDHLFITMPTSVDATGQSIAGTKVISIAPGPSKSEASAPGVLPESAMKAASLTGGAGPTDETTKASEVLSPTASAVVADKRPEAEIPVLVDKSEAKKASGSSLEKLVMTLFVVCALLGAALFGLKRWAARRGKNIASPTKIQILTQHHLGPKKSLAIIQVAGEAILIGITDQNISMLKTLALIDDEVPGHVPKNFADELDNDTTEAQQQMRDEGFEEEDNFALKGLSEVRDMVSTRFGKSRGRDA